MNDIKWLLLKPYYVEEVGQITMATIIFQVTKVRLVVVVKLLLDSLSLMASSIHSQEAAELNCAFVILAALDMAS